MKLSSRGMFFFCLLISVITSCNIRNDAVSEVLDINKNPLPFQDQRYVQFGAKSDCSETPMDLSQFVQLTQSIPASSKDPQQAVLDELQRRQVLQTFTINFDSESAQSPGISQEYPGVIRMRQDGTLIIRYTCDRNAETYGNFEVIAFNQKTNRFEFSSIEMAQPPKDRFHDNPELCSGCHDYGGDGNADLRPNWNMYPDWKGMFGSHDDFFPKGIQDETVDVGHAEGWLPPDKSQEFKDFDKFLSSKVHPQQGRPDPCYATLPWLKAKQDQKIPEVFARWPYGVENGSAQKRVYATRPNLKFTEVLSKLLARRNFRRLEAEPSYSDLRLYLAVEAAYCTDPSLQFQARGKPILSKKELDEMIAKLLPNYARPKDAEAKPVDLRGNQFLHHDPRHPNSRAQALFGVWKALGWSGGEWTMVPFEYDEPQYETGAGPGTNQAFPADLPLTAYTQFEILDSVVATLPDQTLRSTYERSAGEAADFGEHFACIDKLAGPVSFNSTDSWKRLCNALVTEAKNASQNVRVTRGGTRGLPPSASRGATRSAGIPKFDPKNVEKLEDYLRRVNQQLKARGQYSY
jgi:hypothetical protein